MDSGIDPLNLLLSNSLFYLNNKKNVIYLQIIRKFIILDYFIIK